MDINTMGTPTTTPDSVSSLRDWQALKTLAMACAELSDEDMPDTVVEQTAALQVLADGLGCSFPGEQTISTAVHTGGDSALADAARELLIALNRTETGSEALRPWIEEPPYQEEASLPEAYTGMMIFTGCVVALQVAGHVQFRRKADGKWSFSYDPARKAPLDDTMKVIVQILQCLGGGASSPDGLPPPPSPDEDAVEEKNASPREIAEVSQKD